MNKRISHSLLHDHRGSSQFMSTPLANERRRPSASATVDRHVHQQVPPKVEYSLTPLGRELEPMLYAMHAWGEKLENNSNKAASRRRL